MLGLFGFVCHPPPNQQYQKVFLISITLNTGTFVGERRAPGEGVERENGPHARSSQRNSAEAAGLLHLLSQQRGQTSDARSPGIGHREGKMRSTALLQRQHRQHSFIGWPVGSIGTGTRFEHPDGSTTTASVSRAPDL